MPLIPGKKNITVTVSDELFKKVESLAQKDRRSKSFIVNDILERYIDEYAKKISLK